MAVSGVHKIFQVVAMPVAHSNSPWLINRNPKFYSTFTQKDAVTFLPKWYYSKFCGSPVLHIMSALFVLVQVLWFPVFEFKFTLFALGH